MEPRPDHAAPAAGPSDQTAAVAARLLAALPDGILAFDAQCRYTAWNPAMERISGVPAAGVLGRVAWEVFPFLAEEGEDAFFHAALAGEERTVDDRRFHVPETAREGFFQARYAPLRDAAGAVAGGMAIVRDVTGNRAADQAMRMQARVLESMSEGVSVSDEEGVILYTNPAEDRMFGYEPGELAGLHVTVQNAYPPEENRRIVGEVIEELRRHGAWTGEWRNRRKDGSEFFTWSRITALEMAGRRYWVCVQEDVTERKRARAELEAARDEAERRAAALRDGERRFRSFVEASARIVWSADPAGEVAHVEGWSALTGQSADDMALAGWLEALHPDDRAGTVEAWTRALAEGSLYECRFRVRVRSGAYRWYLSRAAPVADDDGRVREWVGTLADVDERVRDEERRAFLAEASRLLGASLEYEETLASVARYAVPFLADYCSVDLRGDGGRIRRVACAHVDAAKEELLREMWARYPFDPADRVGAPVVIRTGEPIFMPAVESALVTAFARDAEHLAMLRSLASRSFVCVPLVARGELFGALSLVFTEDSGRTYEAPDVEVAGELAARAAVAIEHARLFAEAEEANRAKSLFLATMSHEIRTPINAIMGYADLMELGLGGPLTERQREQIGRMKSSSRHLLGLVNDVLDLAKVESGEMAVAREEAELATAAEEALALVGPQAAAAGLALEDRCRDSLLRYAADPDRVRQVLVNLLSNAVKFTPAGGRITLGCASVPSGGEGAPAGEGPWTSVWVEDTGIGIAPEMEAVVFEPFVQAESGHTRRAGGTGLGLTISRRLARLMGGDVTLRSTLGAGSRFTLWLPPA